jgi:hypothetical protein
MALQKFLVDFDLNGNQIKNAVLGTVAGTTPGAIWFDSSSKEIKYVDETGSVKVVVPTTVTDALASDIADVVADLSSEVSRATGVEAGLASDISDVVADLAAETSARQSDVSGLTSDIATINSTIAALDATYATDAQVTEAVAVETAARLAAQTSGGAEISTALTNEANARIAGDSALDGRLDTVESTLAALDATYATDAEVTAAVAVETSAREAAVAGVASDLSDEAAARSAADSGLAQDIADETSARETAVSNLASDLSDETSRATAAEAGLASDISDVVADLSSEVSRATAAEVSLDGRLDTVESTLAALDATYATDAEVAAAIAVETAARTAGGAAISTTLTNINNARIAGDDALDARLDIIEGNFTRKYAVAVGNGSATSFTVTHNLGSTDVVVSVREASTGAVVVAAVTHSTDNTVTVEVNGTAPANNALKVVVIG